MIYIYIYIYISHTRFIYAGACGLERGRRFCGFRIRDWSGGGGEEGAVTQLVAWVATLVAYYWCCRCILHFFSFSVTPFQCSSQQQLKITHMYFPFFFFFFFFWLSVFKHLLLFFFFLFSLAEMRSEICWIEYSWVSNGRGPKLKFRILSALAHHIWGKLSRFNWANILGLGLLILFKSFKKKKLYFIVIMRMR